MLKEEINCCKETCSCRLMGLIYRISFLLVYSTIDTKLNILNMKCAVLGLDLRGHFCYNFMDVAQPLFYI